MKSIIQIICFSILLFAQLIAQDLMIIKLNGHSYQVEDIFTKKLNEYYEENKETIKADIVTGLGDADHRLKNNSVTNMPDLTLSYSFDDILGKAKLKVFLNNIKTRSIFNGECVTRIEFDLTIEYLLNIYSNELGIYVSFTPEDPIADDVTFNTYEKNSLNIFQVAYCAGVDFAVNLLDLEDIIEDGISPALIQEDKELLKFADLSDVSIDQAEIDALEQSFPLNGILAVDGGLIVEVNFHEGDVGQYKNITPNTVPAGGKLDIGGIAFLRYHLQDSAFNWHTTWTPYQRIDAAFNKMQQRGLTGCRVEARWDAIQSSSEVVLGQNPANITDADIDAIINNGAAEWHILDYILDKAYEKDIIVHMAVGVGHDTRPPGTPTLPSASISPDNSGSFDSEGNHYIAVSASDYLYNLELSSRAIIRKYANRIGVWQIENELNAARFTEAFKWWRKGNLWRDDQPGGFQDDVWNTLVASVQTEDPRSKIIHDFHMFDFADRLERWGADCDIIGANFYPNQLFAYPVLDFAVGEYVWAVRRMLKGLGMENKDVWITETSYPAKTAAELPEPYTVDDDIMHFSHQRQTQYIENSIQYSIDNGAKGFFYHTLTNSEDGGSPSTPEMNRHISYGGLILPDGSDTEKPALANFGTKYVAKHPGIGKIRLYNRYNGVNIGNKVSLKGEHDFLDSGDETLIIKEIKHTGRTEIEKAVYNTEKIKHHEWDDNTSKFKMDDNNLFVVVDVDNRNANFKATNTGSFSISTKLLETGAIDVGEVQLKDPWFVETDGRQLSQFKSYTAPFTPGSGSYSWYDGLFLGEDYTLSPTYYSLKAPAQTINGTTWDFYGWGKSGASLQNWQNNETAVVFYQPNATVTAYYKGRLRSNLTSAYASNSQRKIVQTDDGIYHTVYVSDYYDIQNENTYPVVYHAQSASADFSANWTKDEIFPFTNWENSHNPSLDYYGNTLYLVYELVYNSVYDPDIYLIKYDTQSGSSDYFYVATYNAAYGENAKPVVAVTDDDVFVAWKPSATSGYKYSVQNRETGAWRLQNASVQNTSGSSKNLTLSAFKYPYFYSYIHMAWQHSDAIKYQLYYTKANNPVIWKNYTTVSSGSGFSYNLYPSIVATDEYKAALTWQGKEPDVPVFEKTSVVSYIYKTVMRVRGQNSWGSFYQTGDDVGTANINASGDGYSVVVFNQNDNSSSRYIKRTPTGSYTTDYHVPAGMYAQVSNGADIDEIKSMTFKSNGGLPYKLQKTETDYGSGGISKSAVVAANPASRQGVVTKGDLEFVFNIGDVLLDGQNIEFVEFSDTNSVATREILNSVTRTNDMPLTAESLLFFSHTYYVSNKDLADSLLSENDEVRFRVELVHASNNTVSGVIDQVVYNKDNVDNYIAIDYQLDCSGLTTGDYYLRLITDVEGMAEYYLGNGHNSEESLAKKTYQQLQVDGISLPLTYKLSQNFPNPFNPVTTISYEVPKDSKVQIKVFDIAGREITTLVDDHKTAGSYQVSFDATNLATGMYIYRIVSGDFISQKKMVLIK